MPCSRKLHDAGVIKVITLAVIIGLVLGVACWLVCMLVENAITALIWPFEAEAIDCEAQVDAVPDVLP
ncbi:MAG TPA: hypothetical protein VGY91_15615 [Chthoniobacterales bacterium]|nr:hypothetical protein [Chthoniobacterales bacterium]